MGMRDRLVVVPRANSRRAFFRLMPIAGSLHGRDPFQEHHRIGRDSCVRSIGRKRTQPQDLDLVERIGAAGCHRFTAGEMSCLLACY